MCSVVPSTSSEGILSPSDLVRWADLDACRLSALFKEAVSSTMQLVSFVKFQEGVTLVIEEYIMDMCS